MWVPCKCVWSTRSEEIENVCIDFSGFPSPHTDSIWGSWRTHIRRNTYASAVDYEQSFKFAIRKISPLPRKNSVIGHEAVSVFILKNAKSYASF